MLFIAFKRLTNRPLLTLLSILGATLSVGLVVSIPIFAKAVSFVMLQEQLDKIAAQSRRPPFSIHFYVLPQGQYPLSMERAREWQEGIAQTLVNEIGVPLLAASRQMETTGLVLRTRESDTFYGRPNTILLKDTNLTILPGIESRITIVQGEPMENSVSTNDLNIWLHKTLLDEIGLEPGELVEIRDLRRGLTIPVRVAGAWKATNPQDVFWFSNPDMSLRRSMLVTEADYANLVEKASEEQLGFASWYFILDQSKLSSERMQDYANGIRSAMKLIAKYIPDPRMDSSPLSALDNALDREADLTVLMFVFSVPVMGFLLYFLTLLSSITIRWQQRETAVMVSRGMRRSQLLVVSLIEALVIIGAGIGLGFFVGIQLASAMGYTESFMRFTWREPLPVSLNTFNLPMLLAAISAALLARLWPIFQATRTSVVSHERARARAPQKPFWQRFYLDLILLVPLAYAYRQLVAQGTLVPQALSGEGGLGQDPLLFLVPALFTLNISLILVRIFPILMRLGDWLSALGRDATLYLAFRQLARQSSQYTSALLLVITSLGLGAFMASMAVSLDQWLLDQVYYAVGSDVLLKQTINPDDAESGVMPTEGAWILPPDSYEDVPGILYASRVGMYAASISLNDRQTLRGLFLGVDRLDLPSTLFFRSDFSNMSLGGLMNQLAAREDAVLVSRKVLERSKREIGDKIPIRVSVVDVALNTQFTIAGIYDYFPTVYETDRTAVIGNLDFLFDQAGGTALHDLWLKTDPTFERKSMTDAIEGMGVYISRWVDAREEIEIEKAKVERIGIFGTLTIGFLAAAILSGIGLLIYNYASLQERLFRFTILRAVGLSLLQVISQVSIEYMVLMVYSVLGGAAIGIWASRLFIPFFQAADMNVLRPPTMIPLIAWEDIMRISAVFTVVLILAQIAVISAALRKGVFQALRIGDQE